MVSGQRWKARSGKMIRDCFYFYNELDLLEIRLNILDSVVDRFTIIESTQSFMGIERALLFPQNYERFEKWMDKIDYYVVYDYPHDEEILNMAKSNSNVGAGEHYWVREFYIKESLRKALKECNTEDDDVVFISDCDEIWNPEKLNELKDFSKYSINRPVQLAYYYYLNNRCNEEQGWTGTTVCKYHTIKDGCINDIRTRSKTKYREVLEGGWHFGGGIGVGPKRKLEEWGHTEYNDWIATMDDRVKNLQDYRGRDFKFWKSEEELPKYIKDNKERWKNLFLP